MTSHANAPAAVLQGQQIAFQTVADRQPEMPAKKSCSGWAEEPSGAWSGRTNLL